MYSDIALQVAIKFNELPAEKKILIMQSILIIAEVIAFLSTVCYIILTDVWRPGGEMAYAADLKSASARNTGSSPVPDTTFLNISKGMSRLPAALFFKGTDDG